jgi:Polyketide synthase dehydratase
MIGLLAKNLPSNHHPSELPILMEPRLIELCFQTAGLWEIGAQDRMGLPHHVQCVSSAKVPDSHVRLYAVVTPDPAHGTFDAEVVDEDGRRYVHLGGYRTIAMPSAVNADHVKTLHAMLSPTLVAA